MAKTKAGFKNHPETAEGEVFLTNISTPDEGDISHLMIGNRDGISDWASIGWITKRIGSVAYDIYGKPISGMRPVFVQRAELKKGGINPDTIWER